MSELLFETALEAGPWETVGGEVPWHRLLATLSINGTPHHLEAIAVRPVATDAHKPLRTAFEDRLDKFLEAASVICGDDRFQTTTIDGREYVVILTPYAC